MDGREYIVSAPVTFLINFMQVYIQEANTHVTLPVTINSMHSHTNLAQVMH
jgi:hypothetical protein